MPDTLVTRFRDVPFEQLLEECFAKSRAPDARVRSVFRDQWETIRGKPCTIKLPPVKGGEKVGCGGPWFNIIGVANFLACSHIVEIGD